MNSKYVDTKLDYISILIKLFEAKQLDEELKSHAAKYLTVLISGIYEECIKSILEEVFKQQSLSKEMSEFLSNQLECIFRNPDESNIKGLLKKFNQNWCGILDTKIAREEWDALNSIVGNKNNIAHGDKSEITFTDICIYYEKSKKIIFEIDNIVFQKEHK